MSGTPSAVLGLRAFKGGAVAVAVTTEAGEPRLLLSTILATAADDDPLSFEPYRIAAAMARGPDGKASPEAATAVAEGRRRQAALATDGLATMIGRLEETGHAPTAAALLVNRAGWVTDLLDYSLAWPDHVPVAEGLAVRDAVRAAIAKAGLAMVEQDEKSLADRAAEMLGLPAAAIDARLKALGASAGKPWRKEQKLACLAAWVTLGTPR